MLLFESDDDDDLGLRRTKETIAKRGNFVDPKILYRGSGGEGRGRADRCGLLGKRRRSE